MPNEIVEITLSSDEDSSSQVIAVQNVRRKTSANNKVVSEVPLAKKPITSFPSNLRSIPTETYVKDSVCVKSEKHFEITQIPSYKGGSKNSVIASSNKPYKNSYVKANSIPFTQHNKESKSVGTIEKYCVSQTLPKTSHTTARKSMKPVVKPLDKTKWRITTTSFGSSTHVQSKSPLFTPRPARGLSVTPVCGSQLSTKANTVSNSNADISIIKLNTNSATQKAKKSLPNSKCMLPEDLKRTLSKSGISITNVGKDLTNNARSNVNASISNDTKKLPSNLTSVLNSQTFSSVNRHETQQRKSSCDITSNSTLGIISLDSQKVTKSDYKSCIDSKLKKNKDISVSVNPSSNCVYMEKNDRGQNIKPSKSENKSLPDKELKQVIKNSSSSKTFNTQIRGNSEISITKVARNEERTSSLLPHKAKNLGVLMQHKQPVSLLKRKHQNSEEERKLQPNTKSKHISTAVNTNNIIQLNSNSTLLNSSSTSAFTATQERISWLKKSLDANQEKKSIDHKKLVSNSRRKDENNSATDIEIIDISIQKVALEKPTQKTVNSEQSPSSKLIKNCFANAEENQTSNQRPPRKQVTSPKLSLKRKSTVSEDNHPNKKNKVESFEEWNKPSTSTHIDMPAIEASFPWNNSDSNLTKLEKVLDYCVPIMKKQEYYNSGEEVKISKSLLKSFKSTEPSYASSMEFTDLLLDTFRNIKTKPKELFQHLIKMKSTLSSHKHKRSKSQPSDISQEASQNTKIQPTIPQSPFAHSTLENPEVQSASLVSPISPAKPDISGDQTKPLESHSTAKVQTFQAFSTVHRELNSAESVNVMSPVVNTAENDEAEPASVELILDRAAENGEAEPASVELILDHAAENGKAEPGSVESIVDLTAENLPRCRFTASMESIVDSNAVDLEAEPAAVESSILKTTAESLMSEPAAVESSILKTTAESMVSEPAPGKSSVHNTPQRPPVLIKHSSGKVTICSTENLKAKTISPTTMSEKAQPTLMKSSIEHMSGYPEVKSIPFKSVCNVSETMSIKPSIVCDTPKISSAQLVSSITLNSSKNVQDSSLSVGETSKLENTCKPPSGLNESEFSEIVRDLPKVELDKLKLASGVPKSKAGECSTSSSNPCPDIFEAKLNGRIKYLEQFLEKLHKKIMKLSARDFSLEEMDDNDSAYMREDQYKRKIVKVWEKLCSLQKCSARFGRAMDKRFIFNGTRYDQVNKAVEKFINKKKPSDRFPNYNEVLDLIKKVNEVHNLGLPTRSIENTAKEVFSDIGLELKKRRIKDYRRDFGCSLIDDVNFEDDPADHDENLNKVLIESVSVGEKKIAEVINKYANENVDDVAEDGDIEGDLCEALFEEKDNNELPETDPATNSSGADSDDSTSLLASRALNEKGSCVTIIDGSSDASTEPDTSKPTTKNISSIVSSVDRCSDASTEPDTSKPSTRNVSSIVSSVDDRCSDASTEPDTSKPTTKNISSIVSSVYDRCSDASTEPNTSKPTTKNISSIVSSVNDHCSDASTEPDISKGTKKISSVVFEESNDLCGIVCASDIIEIVENSDDDSLDLPSLSDLGFQYLDKAK